VRSKQTEIRGDETEGDELERLGIRGEVEDIQVAIKQLSDQAEELIVFCHTIADENTRLKIENEKLKALLKEVKEEE